MKSLYYYIVDIVNVRFSLSKQKTIDSIQRQLQRNPVSMGGVRQERRTKRDPNTYTKTLSSIQIDCQLWVLFTFSTAKKPYLHKYNILGSIRANQIKLAWEVRYTYTAKLILKDLFIQQYISVIILAE